MPAALSALRHERIVLAIAALPIAAVDVDGERRLRVAGAEEIVAMALLRPIGLVEVGLGGLAVGRRCRRPARIDLRVLRHALAIVVLGLEIEGGHGCPSSKTGQPEPAFPPARPRDLALPHYSGTCSPEPPKSAGKSFSFGSPSRIGRTVSA